MNTYRCRKETPQFKEILQDGSVHAWEFYPNQLRGSETYRNTRSRAAIHHSVKVSSCSQLKNDLLHLKKMTIYYNRDIFSTKNWVTDQGGIYSVRLRCTCSHVFLCWYQFPTIISEDVMTLTGSVCCLTVFVVSFCIFTARLRTDRLRRDIDRRHTDPSTVIRVFGCVAVIVLIFLRLRWQ